METQPAREGRATCPTRWPRAARGAREGRSRAPGRTTRRPRSARGGAPRLLASKEAQEDLRQGAAVVRQRAHLVARERHEVAVRADRRLDARAVERALGA